MLLSGPNLAAADIIIIIIIIIPGVIIDIILLLCFVVLGVGGMFWFGLVFFVCFVWFLFKSCRLRSNFHVPETVHTDAPGFSILTT